MTRFQALTRTTVIATLILIGLGSAVRTTGSGLGCPDWPLCHGSVIPPMERTSIIEWTHRTVASLTGLLIVVQATWSYVAYRSDRALTRIAISAVPLVAVQAILGREAVVRELPPGVVAVHMVSALLLLAMLAVVAVFASVGSPRERDHRPERARFRAAARFTALVIAMVMVLGAYNLASGGGFACPSWPGCPGAPIPFLSGGRLHHIHWLHRLTVVAGLVAVALLVRRARDVRETSPSLARGAAALLALYLLQAAIGAVTIWSDFASGVRSAHLFVGATTWAIAVAVLAAAEHVRSPSEVPHR